MAMDEKTYERRRADAYHAATLALLEGMAELTNLLRRARLKLEPEHVADLIVIEEHVAQARGRIDKVREDRD
jgi:hypothetical protein